MVARVKRVLDYRRKEHTMHFDKRTFGSNPWEFTKVVIADNDMSQILIFCAEKFEQGNTGVITTPKALEVHFNGGFVDYYPIEEPYQDYYKGYLTNCGAYVVLTSDYPPTIFADYAHAWHYVDSLIDSGHTAEGTTEITPLTEELYDKLTK